jgi:hypothetical protein
MQTSKIVAVVALTVALTGSAYADSGRNGRRDGGERTETSGSHIEKSDGHTRETHSSSHNEHAETSGARNQGSRHSDARTSPSGKRK